MGGWVIRGRWLWHALLLTQNKQSQPSTHICARTQPSSVARVPFKRGGPVQAKALLARFLRDRLSGYAAHRKEANLRHQSFLSPYLHFGHLSSLYMALKVT